jgi:hypothetical protein
MVTVEAASLAALCGSILGGGLRTAVVDDALAQAVESFVTCLAS